MARFANPLAIYVERNDSEIRELLVTSKPYRRVEEIWHEDMRFRPVRIWFRPDNKVIYAHPNGM